MKVILLKDVKNIGMAGNVKEVSNGYAKNFLFPNKLAEVATPDLVKKAEASKALEVKKAEENLKMVEELVNSFEGISVKIVRKANDEGKLFGSITPEMITEAIKKEVKTLKSIKINTDSSIKEVGEHKITLNFPHGLEAEVDVIVEKE